MCASQRCTRTRERVRTLKNHVWRNESDIRVGPRPGARTTAGRPNPPEFTRRRSAVGGVSAGSASAGRGRTLSVHVGTRKMVNYAWPG